jgi:hypothetical protein
MWVSLNNIKRNGESASADWLCSQHQVLTAFQKTIKDDYLEQQVFSLNKTGLFWLLWQTLGAVWEHADEGKAITDYPFLQFFLHHAVNSIPPLCQCLATHWKVTVKNMEELKSTSTGPRWIQSSRKASWPSSIIIFSVSKHCCYMPRATHTKIFHNGCLCHLLPRHYCEMYCKQNI